MIWLAKRAFEIAVVPVKAERAMKPSDIEPGFYYEKRNVPGWQRFIVSIDNIKSCTLTLSTTANAALNHLAAGPISAIARKKQPSDFPRRSLTLRRFLSSDCSWAESTRHSSSTGNKFLIQINADIRRKS